MLKKLFAALAILLAGCSAAPVAYVPDVNFDYSGEWTLKWLDSNSRHPVSLAQKELELSGIYTNADDTSCAISGTHTRKPGIRLLIDCPEWDIKLRGLVTQNGTVISGGYKGEKTKGKFVMLKNIVKLEAKK